MAFHVHAWGQSDVGQKRDHNEDSYLMAQELRLYVVADGMGGHAGGEMASGLAVRTVEGHVRAHQDVVAPTAVYDGPVERSPVTRLVADAVRAACRAVYVKSQQVRELQGMGTTTTALLFHGRHAFIGHVGDSRAYLVRDARIMQITEDHSLVQEQMRAGLITDAQARTSRFKNIITRSVGFDADVEVDIIAVEVKPGDAFLVCCDGLSNMVNDQEICSSITESFVYQVPAQLIDLANERGGDDNITVIVCVATSTDDAAWTDNGPTATVVGGAACNQSGVA